MLVVGSEWYLSIDDLSKIPPEIRVVDLDSSRVLTCFGGLVRYLKQERPANLLSAMGHANVVAILAKFFSRIETKVIVTI